MKLIRGHYNLPPATGLANGCVLTIGNFDGIHLGHQQALNKVKKLSHSSKLPGVVLVFEPTPIEFFNAKNPPVRLMNLREKLQGFKQTDIDFVLVCRFNAFFAELTAEDFVQKILLKGLNVKHLVVGDDFCFGKNRQGNFAYLQKSGKKFGFGVSDLPTYQIDQERVSSTRVRKALQQDDLLQAKRLLGQSFLFDGRVIHGKKLGRKIGFRTLNLNPKRIQMPVSGVFAVKVKGIAKQPWAGVANIGVRPTVNGLRPSIEVHLFNWSKDIYGKHVQIELQAFIRPEIKFDSLDSLVEQIKQDIQQAKQLLKLLIEKNKYHDSGL